MKRFLSVDPVTAYSNPVGAFNRYWYANDNPYRFTDPDGRDVKCDGVKCHINSRNGYEFLAVDLPRYTAITMQTAVLDTAMAYIQAIQAIANVAQSAESQTNNNPYDGPVHSPVIVVDGDGNAIPVEQGEQIKGSPDGRYQQVLGQNGRPTGTRLDKGGHKGQADPKAQGPHGHRPGVIDETGNPHLPLNPPMLEKRESE